VDGTGFLLYLRGGASALFRDTGAEHCANNPFLPAFFILVWQA
jgi:hypothetical protein